MGTRMTATSSNHRPCRHCHRLSILSLFASLASLFLGLTSARAVDREQRDYVIYVNGKEAGQSSMTILKQDDGMTYMSGSVQVKFQQLVFRYNLGVQAAEWWRDGKLVGMKCDSLENGKKTNVVVSAAGQQLQMQVNGKGRPVHPEVWTTSYWKLPDARFHNKPVPLLSVDDGREYNGLLKFVGSETITVMGQPETCYHFRVSGGPTPIDLWFDRYHRLVRQEFVDLGHKTIVHLVSIRR